MGALVAFVGACSLITGIAVWLISCGNRGGNDSAVDTTPITVTQTVAVTITRTAAAPPPSAPPAVTPEPGAVGPLQWVVRTPAGMACLFDATVVTCTGTFDSGATAYQWRNGAAQASALDSAVNLPGDGVSLDYGSRRSAGPWSVTMAESGITFESTTSGATAKFSRAGVEIG